MENHVASFAPVLSPFTAVLLPMSPASKAAQKIGAATPFAGQAWQQVLARDTAGDGRFVYAVKSTGIYCKPSCASRKPQRRNVSFFITPEAAEAAGFRACLRCEPARTAPKPDPQAAAIARAAELLSASRTHVSLDTVAETAGMSRFATLRGFKRVLGVTPGEFARAQRKERFREKVRAPKAAGTQPMSVTEAIYEAGFSSSSRLYEDSSATLGMTPSAMKAGGAGETIRYTVAASPLGPMLVATTERGLCAVLFSENDGAAAADLRERFPQAVLRRDDAGLGEAARFALSTLSENRAAQALPFDVRATAFQMRVWTALLAIPRGETRTYAEIAESIGASKALRAVGTACGANLLAGVIPCHRVVGANGKLTGYRWGTEKKKKLLEMEGVALPHPKASVI